jgi:pimeloyl-ACP methyl ester carboxylesterase
LAVPLDYADPRGRQISLEVSRIRAADPAKRRGVLVLIPGGPGGTGLNRPSGIGASLPQAVRDRYDLIGFDPRGVGKSTQASCDLLPEDASPINLRPWPGPDGDIAPSVAAARRVAKACARNGGDLVRAISTRTEAKDVDGIRRALGEQRISYWATSYGTYVGSVYATLFASRTDRVLLDSNDDPDPRRVERGWLAYSAIGAEDRFPDFAKWASAADNPDRLEATPEAVRATFLAVAAKSAGGNVLRAAMLQYLTADRFFPAFAQLIRAARDGGPLPLPPLPTGQEAQSSAATGIATICNDVACPPKSTREYAEDVRENRTRYPLTAGMPVNIVPCAFWPRPAQPPVTVTPNGPSNVLLVQNRRDPATPYAGALNLRRAFGDRARMVSVDSGGHGAYLANGNTCGDSVVTDFLVTGRRPAADVSC